MSTNEVRGSGRRNLPAIAAGFFALVGVVELVQGQALAAVTDFAFAGAVLLAPRNRSGSPLRLRIAASLMLITAIVLTVVRFTHRS